MPHYITSAEEAIQSKELISQWFLYMPFFRDDSTKYLNTTANCNTCKENTDMYFCITEISIAEFYLSLGSSACPTSQSLAFTAI